jgi:hypothetical protein
MSKDEIIPKTYCGQPRCIVAHLHQAPLDTIAFWNRQRSASVMRILHHRNEFGPFHFFEQLVTCDDPFHKDLLKLLLVPWPLS